MTQPTPLPEFEDVSTEREFAAQWEVPDIDRPTAYKLINPRGTCDLSVGVLSARTGRWTIVPMANGGRFGFGDSPPADFAAFSVIVRRYLEEQESLLTRDRDNPSV